MTSVAIGLGQLTIYRSFLNVPTTAEGMSTAIARFVSEFSEARAADELDKFSNVSLAASAPKGFFVQGSFLVSGDLLKLDVQDGVLRLDLRSHNGTTGSFWVDSAKLKVTKTPECRPVDGVTSKPSNCK